MARIFIVEDDPDVRSLITGTLIEAGHEVAAVADGATALDQLVAEPPDLVVLDLMLPGIDGLAILENIRSSEVAGAAKVIVVSAKSGEEDRRMATELGADAYITKPFDPEDLVEAIGSLIETSPKQAPGHEGDRSYRLSQLDSLR